MSAQDDGLQTTAVAVAMGIVGFVVAGVIGLAVLHKSGPKVDNGTATVVDGRAQLYFKAGSDALPDRAQGALAPLVDNARANTGAVLLISPYYRGGDDYVTNARLAMGRAEQVRHALEANGVPRDRLQVSRPTVSLGLPRDADRVDVVAQ